MKRTIIEFHVIQTVPPSVLNRDESGSPKTAVYGGTRRARVSSQSWKRAMRQDFREHLDDTDIGLRTKQIVAILAERITDKAPDLASRATGLAAEALKAGGIKTAVPKAKDKTVEEAGYLVFLSNRQYDGLATAAVKAERAAEKLSAKEAKEILKLDHSLDIALFGRMVADSKDLSVDAACQVAHALSTHTAQTEFDYYTAIDDVKDDADETGAAMLGTVEFNSSTLYRYAALDVALLMANLGDERAVVESVEAFARSFVRSMPSGKRNTFANRTLPDLVAVRVRDTQSINLVGAYERPVPLSATEGRVEASIERFAAHAAEVEKEYDEQPLHAWYTLVGELPGNLAGDPGRAAVLGERLPLKELVDALSSTVAARLVRKPR